MYMTTLNVRGSRPKQLTTRPLQELQIGERVRTSTHTKARVWQRSAHVRTWSKQITETYTDVIGSASAKNLVKGISSPSSPIAAPPGRAHLCQSQQMSTLNLQWKKKGNRHNLRLSLQEVAESAFAHQDSQTTFNRRFMNWTLTLTLVVCWVLVLLPKFWSTYSRKTYKYMF